jgi:hypothetical protein
MKTKLEQAKKKLGKELKSPILTPAEKRELRHDIKALTTIIQLMTKEMKLTNHNIC